MAVSPPQEAPGGRPVAPDRERRVAEALLAIESLDLNVVLDRICRLTVALMPCDRATAYLYSHRARGFVAVADCGTPPHVFRRFVDKLYFGRSRAGERGRMVPFRTELVAGRIGVATRDDPVEPENCELLEALEQYAMCLVPFRSSTRGALFVTLDRPPVFDDTALRIVQTIARQASNLVDHARTFRTVRHAARVRAGIAALAAAVNRESDPARIAALVSAEAAALFRLAVVAVLVPRGDALVALGSHGLEARDLCLAPGDDAGLLADTMRQGKAVFRNELAGSEQSRLVRDLGLASALAIPLVGRDGPIGCLLLGHTDRPYGFSDEIAEEASVLGPLASAALERAALSRRVERSEEHFRSLIENASDLIVILGADGTFRYQSPSITRILGYAPAELAGRPIADVTHPDDRAALERMFEAVLARATPRGVREARFRRRDGAWRVLEGVGTRMVAADGEPVVVVNLRDVTERKHAEAREHGQKRVLELLARGGGLDEVLRALTEVVDDDLGTTSVVLVFDETRTTLRPACASRLPAALAATLDGMPVGAAGGACGIAARRGQRVIAGDAGSAGGRPGAYWAEPILSAAGEVLGVLALFGSPRPMPGGEASRVVDAAAHLAGIAIERKQAEHELARARDEAIAAARVKAEFLANMSHEIRTPMNGVIGMADLLAESPLTDEQRDFVRTIRSSGEALLAVINDILDVSKIEAGRMTIEHVEFELASVVDEVVALLRPRAEQKGLTLARTLPAALPGRLLGDPHRLRQVLTNLVGNAVKFTERGGVTLGIALLDQAACRARVRITVTDTGIGIPRDRHAAIFDSFTQADGSTTRRYGGTGLGLTISRQLVELMGGRIGVESAPGQGSTFWVELVFETPPTERRGPPPAARSPTPAARARGLRVLVADDDPVSRRIALEMLGRLGCEADGVPGGAGVLAALARARYDVAFVDVQMPDLDGFAVTAAVRRQEAGTRRRLPIVAMTAHAMEEDRERCLTAGMDGYVRKPIRLEDVATALDGLATASASAREASPIADVARADGRAELLGRPS